LKKNVLNTNRKPTAFGFLFMKITCFYALFDVGRYSNFKELKTNR